jgi:hypothetical protein
MCAVSLMLGCSQTTRGQGRACDGWRQMKPTANDVKVISDRFAADILSHNEHGVDIDCWKRPGAKP